jgi:hypothetical protein
MGQSDLILLVSPPACIVGIIPRLQRVCRVRKILDQIGITDPQIVTQPRAQVLPDTEHLPDRMRLRVRSAPPILKEGRWRARTKKWARSADREKRGYFPHCLHGRPRFEDRLWPRNATPLRRTRLRPSSPG